jgi:hypothetical protein
MIGRGLRRLRDQAVRTRRWPHDVPTFDLRATIVSQVRCRARPRRQQWQQGQPDDGVEPYQVGTTIGWSSNPGSPIFLSCADSVIRPVAQRAS